jgi:hypothetical protein
LIDVSDLIDHWNVLGLPLLVQLCSPGSLQSDDRCESKAAIVSSWAYPVPDLWTPDMLENSPTMGSDRILDPPENLKKIRLPINGLEVIQMLLAKTNVHGIIWNQYSDRQEHVYKNAGLIGEGGQRRTLLDGLARLRQLHVH